MRGRIEHLKKSESPALAETSKPLIVHFSVGNSQPGSACMMPQQIGTGPYRIPRWLVSFPFDCCYIFLFYMTQHITEIAV